MWKNEHLRPKISKNCLGERIKKRWKFEHEKIEKISRKLTPKIWQN